MPIEFLDPRGEPETPAEIYDNRVDFDGPITVALVANGFPDSVRFLNHVEASMSRQHPEANFVRYDKGDASSVVSEPLLDEITEHCQAVVAAYGH